MDQQIKCHQLAVRMTDGDRAILLRLAEVEERSPSDIVRRLIRQAAASNGLDRVVAEASSQRDRATEQCMSVSG